MYRACRGLTWVKERENGPGIGRADQARWNVAKSILINLATEPYKGWRTN